ncbi:MAG: hypothetical protein WCT36_01395 [Candidatus Gracilibacteria bacterium]|jgi:hypothetical protein
MKLANFFFGEYLEKGEKIHSVAHVSVVTIWKVMLRVTFLGFALPGLFFIFFPALLIPVLIWMLVGVIKAIYELYGWYYDVFLITNTSIISIKSESIFDVTTNRVEYHMIEGVSYVIKGFWQTILNYGDIKVEKIGAGTPIILKNSSNPARIERVVLKHQDEYMEHRNFQDHKSLKDLLANMLINQSKTQGK